MTKKKEKAQEPSPDQMAAQTLKEVSSKLKQKGYVSAAALKSDEPGLAAAIHWGMHEGVETPRIFALALPKEAWERAINQASNSFSFKRARSHAASPGFIPLTKKQFPSIGWR